MRNERQVQLRVTSNQRSGCQILANTNAIGILKHLLSTLEQVRGVEWGKRTLLRNKLVKQHSVVFTIGHVLGEVVNSAVPLGLLQMVVEPTQKNLLRGKTQELLKCLVLLKQTVQLRVQLDVDFTKQTSSDDLPDETKIKCSLPSIMSSA